MTNLLKPCSVDGHRMWMAVVYWRLNAWNDAIRKDPRDISRRVHFYQNIRPRYLLVTPFGTHRVHVAAWPPRNDDYRIHDLTGNFVKLHLGIFCAEYTLEITSTLLMTSLSNGRYINVSIRRLTSWPHSSFSREFHEIVNGLLASRDILCWAQYYQSKSYKKF